MAAAFTDNRLFRIAGDVIETNLISLDTGQFLQFASVIEPQQVQKLLNIDLRSFDKCRLRGT